MTGADKKSVSVVTLFRNQDQENDRNETRFGMCGKYPKWLQFLASPRVFLLAFCIQNILQGMVFSYLLGTETSVERHFKFDSQTIGLLMTLGEIGPTMTAFLISHMGSRGNRPRWMAFGTLMTALGSFLGFTMNWIFPPPALESWDQLGYETSNITNQSSHLCRSTTLFQSVIPEHGRDSCTIDSSQRHWAFAGWVLINSLMATGGMTLYTIGTSYLDDSVKNKNSPNYFAITIAVRAFGPVFGNFLSSACTRIYVDWNKVPNFKPNDPRWIGAWWLGYLIMSVLLTCYALVLAAFPRRLVPSTGKKDSPEVEKGVGTISASVTSVVVDKPEEKEGKSKLVELKASVWRVIRNPVILCSCGSSVFSIIGIFGYIAWVPKYFEHEFRRSKSSAALLSGLASNVSMIFGVLLSGYLMSRYRPSARTVAASVAISKFIYAFGVFFIVLFNCGYENDLPGTLSANGSLVLSSSCSQDCRCNTEKFSPVCLRGEDGVNQTYFSPCHAGCSEELITGNSTSYPSCLCGTNSKVETGFCMKPCNNMYVYMGVIAVVKFIVSLSYVGNLITDLRCVEERDKALALGILATASGIFAFLPTQTIYGTVVDATCLVWEQSCGERGSCWVYANDKFRYSLHGLTSGCLVIAGIFEVITYFKVKNLKFFD